MQVNEKRFEMFEVVFISPSGVELKSMRQVKKSKLMEVLLISPKIQLEHRFLLLLSWFMRVKMKLFKDFSRDIF